MNRRLLVWIIGGVLLVGLVGALVARFEPFEAQRGAVFIPGDQPVTEDQIRQKLQSEGYSNLQIVRQGRYFEAMGSKDGTTGKIAVDSQTGRLRGADDDED
jgi:hypothetical protein